MIEIDFPTNDSWLDGPLPIPPDNRPPSGWAGLERIMPALVERFCKNTDHALEFGVEYCHSTAALAQLFRKVDGVDWFIGDEHSGPRENYYEKALRNSSRWPNIELHQCSYQDWLVFDEGTYDLIHVDAVHTYEATYTIGRWAVKHAPVTLFHDTQSWPEVVPAVERIAQATGMAFYNYPHCNGLGILA